MLKKLLPLLLACIMQAGYLEGASHAKEKHVSKADLRSQIKSDTRSAQRVADYVVSEEFVTDIHTFLHRSSDPLKAYMRHYFFHCDFHKDQLHTMKHCFGELHQLLQESMPICVHALFSYIVSDAMKKHVSTTAQNALDTRSMAIYAAPTIMEHIEEQQGVLTRQEREQFIILKDKWAAWYDRWSDYLIGINGYVETRTELREKFLDEHKKSLLFSMLWAHAVPGAWFILSKFRIARIMFGSAVYDANYFLMQLMMRLHKNVITQRTALEEKVIARTKESLTLYATIVNQVIDENLARF